MSANQPLYHEYQNKMQKIADIKYAAALLQWDQETYMPPAGAGIRGRQLATLTEMAHLEATSTELGNLLQNLNEKENLTDTQKRNVALSLYDFENDTKLPASFVRESTEAINKSFHVWLEARKNNDFKIFEEPLQKIIVLKRKEAEYLGYEAHPYDALMNVYDKGLTVKEVDGIFENLKPQLSQLYEGIITNPQVNNEFLKQFFPKDKQWEAGLAFLKKINYDFNAGRQDVSEHPFTVNFGSTDVRVTTRVDENDFANMLWSCLHEGGHALYEQGLPAEAYGLPLGSYCSLSIHESQSRFWENNVGRGKYFWQKNYADLQNFFPQQLNAISFNDFYAGINKVQPSLIRTEADEVTYHFHVMIRYEIEKKLIEGSLQAKDIPEVWNEYYQNFLGISVPDDKQGCLQDVHWSHGSFGYFATYSLGSLYAAQFYAAIQKELPAINDYVAAGNLQPLHTWLQQHIYPFGRYYVSSNLCKNATGQKLNSEHFIKYVKNKYEGIYNF